VRHDQFRWSVLRRQCGFGPLLAVPESRHTLVVGIPTSFCQLCTSRKNPRANRLLVWPSSETLRIIDHRPAMRAAR
jgi:hypothetical protein